MRRETYLFFGGGVVVLSSAWKIVGVTINPRSTGQENTTSTKKDELLVSFCIVLKSFNCRLNLER